MARGGRSGRGDHCIQTFEMWCGVRKVLGVDQPLNEMAASDLSG